jgi:hypothetical protein
MAPLTGPVSTGVDDAAFLPEAASAEALMGVSVQLPDHCACGSSIAVVAAGLHRAALHCATCQASRGWLPRAASHFICGISSKFGPLTAPVIIRRGERTATLRDMSPNAHRPLLPAIKERKVMHKHEVFPSHYYNAKNVSTPIMRTIEYAVNEPVGEGANQQQKLVAHFKESDSKLLVVTSTKFDAISVIAQSDDTEYWPGVKIVLEPGKASYQGKLVDSINIRAPRRQAPQKVATAPKAPAPAAAAAEPDFDDEPEEF